MGYMIYGGIQRNLITFLQKLKDKAEIDLLLWGRAKEEMALPEWVNIINVPTVKSVEAAKRENGILSGSFVLSCFGVLHKKRWAVMPKLKKRYDIAIAYPQVGFPKYYVIDKVNANKKYTFYHHGSYECSEQIKAWDKEYYPQYDKLYCVSAHTRDILDNELKVKICYDVMPNFLNIEEVYSKGQEEYLWSGEGLKILTVARLSTEKNMFKVINVAKLMKDKNIKFSWCIAGDGPLFADIKAKIEEDNLQNCVYLLGNQKNPYKLMSSCDIYAQFSQFEADPTTIKEVAVFNKPMVLSNIIAFQNAKNNINNIILCNTEEEIVRAIKDIKAMNCQTNDLSKINATFEQKLSEILGD